MKTFKKHVTKEQAELDEVLDTPEKMDRYKAKAKYSRDRAANSAAAIALRSKDAPQREHPAKDLKTMAKRTAGLRMADKNAMKKTFKALRKEDVDLEEAAPKMKGDWLKKEREKNRAHDAAMGRTPTGRKKPVRQMTSTQKSLAKMRGEEVELGEAFGQGQQVNLKNIEASMRKALKDKGNYKDGKVLWNFIDADVYMDIKPGRGQVTSFYKLFDRAADKLSKEMNLSEEVEINETFELSEEEINNITAEYINENNITLEDLENMSQEQLDEIIGKAIGGAFKVAAKTAVGAGRLAKKAANRMSTAGRADAAEKKAAAAEKKNADRARLQKARDKLRDARKAASDARKAAADNK